MTFTTFTPNCTLPTVAVDYVDSPAIRSTLDIIWTSLSTIIACTYTVLHLNVIADDSVTSRESAWWPDTRRALRNLAIELCMAGVAVLAPEYILFQAISNLVDVHNDKKSLTGICQRRSDVHGGSSKWTSTHTQYALMGGFRLCRERRKDPESGHKESSLEEIILNVSCIRRAIRCGALPPRPPISETEINDHSKASIFAKTLAMWQMVWFGVNVVTRLARGLPLSLLEVGTAAFVLISTVTWGCYFTKPKSVQSGTRLYFNMPVIPEDHGDDADTETSSQDEVQQESGPSREASQRIELAKKLEQVRDAQNVRIKSIFAELKAQTTKEFEFGTSLHAAASLTLPFGAIHIAAWNSNFPSFVDRWLWRASALTITLPAAVMIAWFAVIFVLGCIIGCVPPWRDRAERTGDWLAQEDNWKVVRGVILILYILGRLILLVEMIRELSRLPPEAYMATWMQNLPYLG